MRREVVHGQTILSFAGLVCLRIAETDTAASPTNRTTFLALKAMVIHRATTSIS